MARAALAFLFPGLARGVATAIAGTDAVAFVQMNHQGVGLEPPASVGHAQKIKPGIGWKELQEIESRVQASWCAVKHKEMTHYSMGWHMVLKHVANAMQEVLHPDGEAFATFNGGDAYAFGVAQGQSLKLLHRLLPEHKLLGFDSFAGLPKEDHAESSIRQWSEGGFQPRRSLQVLVDEAGGPSVARVFPGFFNESLTADLVSKENLQPAAYVDVDCDLHISTYQALDWLFAHGIARVGTVVGYDDWWSIPCLRHNRNPNKPISPLSVGEGLAHKEITEKYGVVFECVAGPCKPPPNTTECNAYNNWGPIFVVTSVGEAEGRHGFAFTPTQTNKWMDSFKAC